MGRQQQALCTDSWKTQRGNNSAGLEELKNTTYMHSRVNWSGAIGGWEKGEWERGKAEREEDKAGWGVGNMRWVHPPPRRFRPASHAFWGAGGGP